MVPEQCVAAHEQAFALRVGKQGFRAFEPEFAGRRLHRCHLELVFRHEYSALGFDQRQVLGITQSPAAQRRAEIQAFGSRELLQGIRALLRSNHSGRGTHEARMQDITSGPSRH
jgi:hypothetical protein